MCLRGDRVDLPVYASFMPILCQLKARYLWTSILTRTRASFGGFRRNAFSVDEHFDVGL